MTERPFWKEKKLNDMSTDEWESLCDHCGLCCLVKLEDEDTDEVCYTDVVCRHYDHGCGGCQHYKDRSKLVPDCIQLTPENVGGLHWLPDTCGYRRVYEGRDLADWHPLMQVRKGDPDRRGSLIAGRALNEENVHNDDLEDHIVELAALLPPQDDEHNDAETVTVHS